MGLGLIRGSLSGLPDSLCQKLIFPILSISISLAPTSHQPTIPTFTTLPNDHPSSLTFVLNWELYKLLHK